MNVKENKDVKTTSPFGKLYNKLNVAEDIVNNLLDKFPLPIAVDNAIQVTKSMQEHLLADESRLSNELEKFNNLKF